MVNYVEAVRVGNRTGAAGTEARVADAEGADDLNLTDLTHLGRFNAEQMASGSTHLKPYEIL